MSAQAEAQGLLRMRELAEATGVSAGTIKHYLREGLLPEPVKTSRNMAYYPREFVDRVKLIKQLQEERFLPLKVIKEVLENGRGEQSPERLERLEVITPTVRNGRRRYGPDDLQIIEALVRMRASGYSEALGFTVYDTLIYKRHLEQLVSEEVSVLMERVAGEMDTDEAADLIEQAVEPMRDLITALRAKLVIAELRARRAAQER